MQTINSRRLLVIGEYCFLASMTQRVRGCPSVRQR